MAAVAAKKSTGSPIPKIVLGLILIAAFVVGSILHVMTSEAFFLTGHTVGLKPDWQILYQPIWLVQGKLSTLMAEATMWGWGIELTFLICVVGFEVAHEGVKRSSQNMAHIFRTGMIALILFDGWTDFQYGNVASGFWGQLAFALITSFIVFFFGTIGLHFIESAIGDMRH